MKRLNKIILVLFLSLMSFTVHKFYISITQIDYIKEEKALQITMRFFIDDVERTLQNRYDIELSLATDEENGKTDYYLQKYLHQKFEITISGETQKLNFLGKEYTNDHILIYLEITDVENIDQMEIQNSMLIEEFSEQENYIKININSIKNTFILKKGNDKEMLKF